MPPRITEQRHQGNIESLRSLVNSGSQSVVRDTVVGSAISGSRRKYPLPSIGHRSGKLTVTGYVRGARLGVKALIVQCECNQVEYTVDNDLRSRLRRAEESLHRVDGTGAGHSS